MHELWHFLHLNWPFYGKKVNCNVKSAITQERMKLETSRFHHMSYNFVDNICINRIAYFFTFNVFTLYSSYAIFLINFHVGKIHFLKLFKKVPKFLCPYTCKYAMAIIKF